jgi:cytochrome bd ubiquinol oxidase subunit II
MIDLSVDLTVVWALIIGFAVVAYVVMDGFDLGIGILFPTFRRGPERDAAMNSIAPVWDGNETWLVLGGGGLLAAFPLAYAIILPALYAPIVAMLLGLVLRGVAFEFRWRDPRHQPAWDLAFTVGSLIATFAQGVALGALLQGITISGRAYAGGWWEWLSPFSLLTGAGLVVGYAVLGACWLIWKTEGPLQDQAYRYARPLGAALLAVIAAVSLATLTLEAEYYRRWLAFPGVLATSQGPLASGIAAVMFFRSLRQRR